MEEERDIVVFGDDEGNEFELEIIDYFDYEDEEYAVLVDAEPEGMDEPDYQEEVFIMKVIVDGEIEEFVPADEDKMEALIAIVEQRLAEGCDCDCEGVCPEDCPPTCDCGCQDAIDD